ncbi:MAG TPA: DUF3810 family protein [Vicinamibacterales bacterium]|nr:DUF3810 family protein [Vicinamibacterales bacterium]
MRSDLKVRPWRAALVLCAAAAALLPLPPALVDRWYTARVYGTLQPLVTSFSNLAPFALLDLFIGVIAAAWLTLAVRDLLRAPKPVRGAWLIVARTLVWSSALYLLFVALWGFNYRRPRLRDALPYDASAVTADAAVAAGRLAVDRLNTLYGPAHATGWPAAGAIDPSLERDFARAVRDAGITREVVPARPKRTMLDWYFRRAGVDGMTDPFFLETLLAGSVLPLERPFVVAHEWSHLAGIADEGEANFTAWLSCARGAPPNAYSGWLFLYGELAGAVSGTSRAALSNALESGPRADLLAIRNRYVRDVNPRVSAAGWRVYDSYLKANRVTAGAASYDEVVRLVLGARVAGRPAWQIVLDTP